MQIYDYLGEASKGVEALLSSLDQLCSDFKLLRNWSDSSKNHAEEVKTRAALMLSDANNVRFPEDDFYTVRSFSGW